MFLFTLTTEQIDKNFLLTDHTFGSMFSTVDI